MVGRVLQHEAKLPIAADLLAVVSALADPTRLRIVALLREREQCVCHLTAELGLTQGTISHHMRVLKRAGLVRDRRDPDDARWTYYALDEDAAHRFKTGLTELLDTTCTDPTPASCRQPGARC